MFRRILKSLQVALCLGLLLLTSCSSTVVIKNGDFAQKLSVIRDADNYRVVKLAECTINKKLERAEVNIRTLDSNNRVLEHHWLFIESSAKVLYAFNKDGAIKLDSYVVNGELDVKSLVRDLYQDEKFYSYDIEKLDKSQTKSDKSINNACLIQAINYQANLQEEYGDELAWSGILNVFYISGSENVGHAYCVFRLKNLKLPVEEQDYVRNQKFMAYDIVGVQQVRVPGIESVNENLVREQQIILNRYDAESVANVLKNRVVNAYYDGEK